MPLIIAIVVLVAAVIAGVFFFNNNKTEETTDTTTPTQTTEESNTIEINTEAGASVDTSSASVYVDGTYASDGAYTSPAGAEAVDVSLTIKDGVVVATTFEGHAENPASVNNQKKFAEGYEALVVGKKLDEINLTVVNGSSLTPEGFMDALEDIKEEARA